MRQGTLRLRSVRMKAGGAPIRVISNDRPARVMAELRNSVDRIADVRDDDIAGFALIAWSNDGSTSTNVIVGNGRIVPRFSVPAFVETAVRDFLYDLDN